MKKGKETTNQQAKQHLEGIPAEMKTVGRAGNKQIRDINSKGVFGNATLCAQFLWDNVDIPLLKDVQPEDIEAVTELYQPFIGVEFESDTVNKIRIPSAIRPSCR